VLFTSTVKMETLIPTCVSLHRSAMEKTGEYELIRTEEPGVSELSTVHALRRDGGVQVMANVLGRRKKWV
jgi:hypothetical protein